MEITFLGWGSLIWDKRELPTLGEWQDEGPILPIEFSRVSCDQRLTLVIDEINGVDCRTKYIKSSRTNLRDAIDDLSKREGTSLKKIGYIDFGSQSKRKYFESDYLQSYRKIKRWLDLSRFDAVIWTALETNFYKVKEEIFSIEAACRHLASLCPSEQAKALEYIKNAPKEVVTPLRQVIEIMHKL